MLSIKPPRSTLSWLGLKLLSITLIALSLSACFEEAPQANPRAKGVTVSTATSFARALVSSNFTEAHALLSRQAQQRYSAAQLQQAYADMTSYGDGPGAVDGHVGFMDDWPARQSQDIGWAYVSITGPGFIEAVTVVVAEENGAAKIREIEWGRP
ncbi:hypothetical protein ACIGHJ_14400 [Stutzerimonas kunmingensis]|uniref:hypothetical protein n=1 Tax=Stutzerimonas kunmingensis TaxID=1211807 RepID=UPI0037D7F7B7